MKRFYIWFSRRGFSNEGAIYVCREHLFEEVMAMFNAMSNESSAVRRISRRAAIRDKYYFAIHHDTYVAGPELADVENRIRLAEDCTNELLKGWLK